MDKCCNHEIHAQVEYTNAKGEAVETLMGLDLNEGGDRKMARAMLDEWMEHRRKGSGPDHFMIYAKCPVSSP